MATSVVLVNELRDQLFGDNPQVPWTEGRNFRNGMGEELYYTIYIYNIYTNIQSYTHDFNIYNYTIVYIISG
jgi:hypothetical protein